MTTQEEIMHIFADYHMHSKYSDGRATIREMAEAARDKGLEEITIADHGPRNIGVGVKSSETFLAIKAEIKELNQELADLRILAGAEANVIDLEGAIDVPRKIYKELDMLLVGLHPHIWPKDLKTARDYVVMNKLQNFSPSIKEKVRTTNTKTLVEAMYKHNIDIITHPGLGMPLDLDEVGKACISTNTAFEINTGHAYQGLEEIGRMAELGVKFALNSDAHFTETVGELEPGLSILKQAQVPVEQIINAWVKRL
jgi:putative hydrolase